MRKMINIVASVVILAVGVLCLQLFGEKPEIPKQEADQLSLTPLVGEWLQADQVKNKPRPVPLVVSTNVDVQKVAQVKR